MKAQSAQEALGFSTNLSSCWCFNALSATLSGTPVSQLLVNAADIMHPKTLWGLLMDV